MSVCYLFHHVAVLFALLYWHITESLLLAFVLCRLKILSLVLALALALAKCQKHEQLEIGIVVNLSSVP